MPSSAKIVRPTGTDIIPQWGDDTADAEFELETAAQGDWWGSSLANHGDQQVATGDQNEFDEFGEHAQSHEQHFQQHEEYDQYYAQQAQYEGGAVDHEQYYAQQAEYQDDTAEQDGYDEHQGYVFRRRSHVQYLLHRSKVGGQHPNEG